MDVSPITVVSVYPSTDHGPEIDALLKKIGSDIQHIAIFGNVAVELLEASHSLLNAISRGAHDPERLSLDERARFSSVAANALRDRMSDAGDRFLIVAPSIVPLDLVQGDGCQWGLDSIFAHLPAESPSFQYQQISRSLEPVTRPLESYLLLCPMAMDRAVPRHLQDIIITATAMEADMSVEIWLQATLARSLHAFGREDVSWLHIDTHGDASGRLIMLGPTRDGGQLLAAEDLPHPVRPPLVMPIGCALTGGPESVGSRLLSAGALCTIGPGVIFQSLHVANDEAGEASWYMALFSSLINGNDIGDSLRLARRGVSGGMSRFTWFIIGNPGLRFARPI